MAILALQKLEQRFEEAGEPMDHEYQQLMEGGWGCKGDGSDGNLGYFACEEVFGSGERHVRLLPKAPHYEVSCKSIGRADCAPQSLMWTRIELCACRPRSERTASPCTAIWRSWKRRLPKRRIRS